jgi:hypothetical protein
MTDELKKPMIPEEVLLEAVPVFLKVLDFLYEPSYYTGINIGELSDEDEREMMELVRTKIVQRLSFRQWEAFRNVINQIDMIASINTHGVKWYLEMRQQEFKAILTALKGSTFDG